MISPEDLDALPAIFSADETHRLWISRHRPDLFLDSGYGRALFVMLNPSKAGAVDSDVTWSKCQGFAKGLGATRVGAVNLFTSISTEPGGLLSRVHPNAPEADAMLDAAFAWLAHGPGGGAIRRLIFAYGAPPWGHVQLGTRSVAGGMLRETAGRIRLARALAEKYGLTPMCFGTTDAHWPRHPSRLGYGKGAADFQAVPHLHFAALGIA